jgi:hypothetical protein
MGISCDEKREGKSFDCPNAGEFPQPHARRYLRRDAGRRTVYFKLEGKSALMLSGVSVGA